MGCAKHLALPEGEQGVKIVVSARLAANKSPRYPNGWFVLGTRSVVHFPTKIGSLSVIRLFFSIF